MSNEQSSTQQAKPWGAQRGPLRFIYGEGKNLYEGPEGQYYAPGVESYVPNRDPAYAEAVNRLEMRGLLGSPVTTAAQGENVRTLEGGYLGANPYLDARVNAGLRDIGREYQRVTQPMTTSRFALSRRAMSPAHLNAERDDRARLYEKMGQYEASVRSPSYESERDRMVAASRTAPLIGQMDIQDLEALRRAGAEREGYEALRLEEKQAANQYPWEALARYKGLIGNPIVGYDTHSRQYGAGTIIGNIGSGFGAGGQLIASLASAYCWVAAEYYGWGTPEWIAARRWIVEGWQGRVADLFRRVYRRHGRRVAGWVRRSRVVRAALRPVFAWARRRGEAM